MRRVLRCGVLAVLTAVAIAVLVGCGEEKTTGAFHFFEYEIDFIADLGLEHLNVHSYEGGKMIYQPMRQHLDEESGRYYQEKNEYDIVDLRTGGIETVIASPESYSELNVYQRALSNISSIALLSDGSELICWNHPVDTEPAKNKYLLTLIKDGETAWELDLSDTIMKSELKSTPKIRVADDGTIFMLFSGYLRDPRLFTISGEEIREVEVPDAFAGSSPSLESDGDGRVCLLVEDPSIDGMYVYLSRYDAENGKLSKVGKIKIETDGIARPLLAPGHDLYLRMSGAVWYLDLPTEEGEKPKPEILFEWLDLGLTNDMVQEMRYIGEDEWFVVYKDNDKLHSGRVKRCEMSGYLEYYAAKNGEEAARALENRETLYVVTTEDLNLDAANDASLKLVDSMQRFNRSNQQYEMKLKRIAGDESTVSGNLMRSMMSGDLPDVIAFTGKMRSRNFSRQDMFADLYEFMDGDKEHSRDSFLPCVLSSFEKGGRLPLLTTNFGFETLISVSDKASEISGLTLDETIDYAEALPEGEYFAAIQTAADKVNTVFADDMLRAGLGEFVDYDKKTCDFDNKSFRRLLEFLKDGNATYNSERLDNALVTAVDMGDFGWFLMQTKPWLIGHEMVMVGYPHGDDTNGAAIYPKMQLAIPDGSANKEGAWAFVTGYIDSQKDEFASMCERLSEGKTTSVYAVPGFPCTKEAAESLLAYLSDTHYDVTVTETVNKTTGKTERRMSFGPRWNYKYDYNENGERVLVEYDYSSPEALAKRTAHESKDGASVTALYSEFTEPELNAFRAVFNEKCLVWSDDNETMNIINEEISGYFAGTKTLDEVVGMIQDRVTTRINE